MAFFIILHWFYCKFRDNLKAILYLKYIKYFKKKTYITRQRVDDPQIIHEVRAGPFGLQTPPFRVIFGRSRHPLCNGVWTRCVSSLALTTFFFFIFSLSFSSLVPPPSKFHIKPFGFFFLHIWFMSFLLLLFYFE